MLTLGKVSRSSAQPSAQTVGETIVAELHAPLEMILRDTSLRNNCCVALFAVTFTGDVDTSAILRLRHKSYLLHGMLNSSHSSIVLTGLVLSSRGLVLEA